MNPQLGEADLLEGILRRYKDEKGNIISLLREIQEVFGYIPEDVVDLISKRLEIPESKLYGLVTFYAQFHLKPRGKNVITVCCGTACQVKGSDGLIEIAKKGLNLRDAQNTTDDREFTLEEVACVGACSIAPVVIINKKVCGNVTVNKLAKEIKALKKSKDE